MTRFTKIPFCGFYHSSLDQAIDHEIENVGYNRVQDGSNEGDESSYPAALRLSESDICDAFYASDVADFGSARLDMAKAYLEQFDSLVEDHLGESLGLTFESISSPRFYNFETDRLFAFISDSSIERLWKINESDGFKSLAKVIESRFTSRSGFISHYPNDLDSWRAKPLADYDHNEIETLLMAALESRGMWRGYSSKSDTVTAIQDEAEMDVIESFSSNGEFDQYVNWAKHDSELAEKRVAKLEALEDSEAAEILHELRNMYPDGFTLVAAAMDNDYRARILAIGEDPDHAAPRCPLTLDIFDNVNQESRNV